MEEQSSQQYEELDRELDEIYARYVAKLDDILKGVRERRLAKLKEEIYKSE